MIRYLILYAALLLVVLVGGCDDERYSIEMKPRGDGVERKLVVSGKFSDETRARISGLYGKQIDVNSFVGTFVENLPNDVGGAGYYIRFGSQMGESMVYCERFKGDNNLSESVEQVQLIAERFVDFLVGWLAYELGDDPNFVRLKDFFDDRVRNDARNVVIFWWLGDVLSPYDENASRTATMRVKHYLVEQGYFDWKEALLLDCSYKDEELRLLSLRRIVSDKMGYSCGKTAGGRLGFLSNAEVADESMQGYLQTTDYYLKEMEEWEGRKKEPNEKPPEIDFDDYVMRDIDFDYDLFGTGQRVEVKLLCKDKPFESNGKWDPNTMHVGWAAKIAGAGKLPTLFYARCSEPNEEFQKEHFGKLVLSEKALAEYCSWRDSLNEENEREWDSFVADLDPNQDLEEEIGTFRFPDEKCVVEESGERKGDVSGTARGHIIRGLGKKN